jgi:chromosome segregation ATPase
MEPAGDETLEALSGGSGPSEMTAEELLRINAQLRHDLEQYKRRERDMEDQWHESHEELLDREERVQQLQDKLREAEKRATSLSGEAAAVSAIEAELARAKEDLASSTRAMLEQRKELRAMKAALEEKEASMALAQAEMEQTREALAKAAASRVVELPGATRIETVVDDTALLEREMEIQTLRDQLDEENARSAELAAQLAALLRQKEAEAAPATETSLADELGALSFGPERVQQAEHQRAVEEERLRAELERSRQEREALQSEWNLRHEELRSHEEMLKAREEALKRQTAEAEATLRCGRAGAAPGDPVSLMPRPHKQEGPGGTAAP